MLRLNEVKLPLNHTENELKEAVILMLEINPEALLEISVFKRSFDARKKANILLIYQLDVTLDSDTEKNLLQKFSGVH
jgi:uncharacterized FAD-dependent dehydrogenase